MKRTFGIRETVIFLAIAFAFGLTVQQAEAAGFFRRMFRVNVVKRQYSSAPYRQHQTADASLLPETEPAATEAQQADSGNFVESESDGSESDSITLTEITAPIESATEENAPIEADSALETPEATETGETDGEDVLEVDGLTLTETERHVYEYTNAERKRRGLAPLKLNRRLVESARRQASWMAQTGVFRHGNSGFAENIAMGQPSPQAVVRAWMNSSGHMRNMMNHSHGCIGIGAFRGRNGQLYWCQQFSR